MSAQLRRRLIALKERLSFYRDHSNIPQIGVMHEAVSLLIDIAIKQHEDKPLQPNVPSQDWPSVTMRPEPRRFTDTGCLACRGSGYMGGMAGRHAHLCRECDGTGQEMEP